jgi:hypothetical protein
MVHKAADGREFFLLDGQIACFASTKLQDGGLDSP